MDTNLKDKIVSALGQLDHADKDHWTDDGLPRTSVVQRFANDETIRRVDINDASPGFARKDPNAAPQAETEPVVTAPAVTTEGSGEELSENEVRAVLHQRVVDAEAAVQTARTRITEARAVEQTAIKALTEAQLDEKRRFPPLSPIENTKQWIATQNAQRAAAAGHAGTYPPSQIDAAMRRGNSRGWKRPTRDPIGAGA